MYQFHHSLTYIPTIKMFTRTILQQIRRYSQQRTTVSVLGVPFEKGQLRVGVGNGPKVLRKLNLIESLKSIEQLNVEDAGDIEYEACKTSETQQIENLNSLNHVAACTQQVSKEVSAIVKQNKKCLCLGGDHAISVGTIDGHIKAAKGSEIAVIWVDAHADLNTNKTSPSGNAHGMSMALLARELTDYWPYLPGMDWQKPIMSIRNLAYIGLREIDSYERLVINKLGITAFGMEDIERLGVSNVIELVLERIDPENNRSLHVSLDIDALDPLEAPSTGTPVRGGLTLRETIHILEKIHKTQRLTVMDLVEFNPSLGGEDAVRRTYEAIRSLTMAAFGHSRRGLMPNAEDLPLQTFHNTPKNILQ